MPWRLFRKAVQQGRSEQRGEAYSPPYVEPLSEARTPRADFINSLIGAVMKQPNIDRIAEQPVSVMSDQVALDGFLSIPPGAIGVVLFAHGSGSGRFSPRNRYVAHRLQSGGIATLLIDLLTVDEAEDRRNVFDIDLLADRVLMAGTWLGEDERTKHLPLGYFGASTGAGAALQAAARCSSTVKAVVSRGGRPDLAERYLPEVTAPTLLLVGGYDEPVIEMNQAAFRLLPCQKELTIIPGATHLFEEPGTLEQVADRAVEWFVRCFVPHTEHRHTSRKKENQR